MIVTPVEFDLDLTQAAPGYVRTRGLHMSDIYGPMYEELEPERYGRKDTAVGAKAGYMGAGLALEEALERSLAGRLSGDGRPGELVEPEFGIIYSPDLWFFMVDSVRVGEIKLTWQSSREYPKTVDNGFPQKADKWITQLKLYCRCVGTVYGRVYALFVNGTWDHKDKLWGFKPQPLAWDVQFVQRELDEEWHATINFAKKRGLIT